MESSELAEARDKYTGRLTREMLEECLGHKHFNNLKVQTFAITIRGFPTLLSALYYIYPPV